MAGEVCIYCGAALGRDTRRAHVIPSALGGRKASRAFCCSLCNNAIGSTEKALCEALRGLTAMVGVRRGDRRPAPSVRVEDALQGPLDVWGGVPKAVAQAPNVVAKGDNHIDFAGAAPDIRTLARQFANLLRRFGKTPEALERGEGISFQAAAHVGFADNVEFNVVVGSPEHMRAIAKMPVELLAVHAPDLVTRPELRRALAFVRNGTPELEVFGDAGTAGLLPAPVRPPLHLCEVWSAGPHVIGRLVLYGAYPFTLPLTGLWTGPPFQAIHVVDPVNGQVLADAAEYADGPLPAGWPNRSEDPALHDLYLDRFNTWFAERMASVTADEVGKRVKLEWVRSLAGREPDEADLLRLGQRFKAERDRHAARHEEFSPVDKAQFLRLVRDEFERLAAADDPRKE
jgi:hypothetical protein